MQIGSAKHPLFLFQKKYWCSSAPSSEDEMETPLEFTEAAFAENSSVEPINAEDRGNAKVILNRIRKRYSDGKLAVKHLSLAMLEGQITCLLGHNGAGMSNLRDIIK